MIKVVCGLEKEEYFKKSSTQSDNKNDLFVKLHCGKSTALLWLWLNNHKDNDDIKHMISNVLSPNDFDDNLGYRLFDITRRNNNDVDDE